MKTVAKKRKPENSKSNSSTPFFDKSGAHSFFAQTKSSSTPFFTVQPKLSIGKPGDKYEKEADAMADKVVNSPTNKLHHSPTIQPKCEECEKDQAQRMEEEEIQTKPLFENITPLVQRQVAEEEELQTKADLQRQEGEEEELQAKADLQRQEQGDEEEELQTKTDLQRQEGEEEELQTKADLQRQEQGEEEVGLQTKTENNKKNPPPTKFQSKLKAFTSSGEPLSKNVKQEMESGFGADFSDVRIHRDSNAAQLNSNIKAQAFTHGKNIYFNKGKYDTGSSGGKHLLAHELTHVVQQGGGIRKMIQRSIPDEEKLLRPKNKSKKYRLNILYWDKYELYELNPLRGYNPYEHPNAYANRTYKAQKILKKGRRKLWGKKIWVDGIFGPETLTHLYKIAKNESFADLRFQISGLGFDLESIASTTGFTKMWTGLVELFKPKFLFEWDISIKGETAIDWLTIRDEEKATKWYDGILFGGPAPAHLTKDEFDLADRHAILKKAYKDHQLQGRAALVEAKRAFLHKREDTRILAMRDKNRKSRFWIAGEADREGEAKERESRFNISYPGTKAERIREKIGLHKVGQDKYKVIGLLTAFYIPELTLDERLRLQLVAMDYLKEKATSEEGFIRPNAEKLIKLIESDDSATFWHSTNTNRHRIALQIENVLNAFWRRPDLFEKMATLLEKHEKKNYFDLLINRVLQFGRISPLQTLLQLCNQTRFKDYPNVIKAFDHLHKLKRNIRSHDYVAGTKDEQGVWIKKKRGEKDFLKVGDVTDGIYRITEDRDTLKEAKRAQLEKKMRELIETHIGNSLSEKASQKDMNEQQFTEMILEKAAQEVGVTEDDFETVKYERAFRLKGVESTIINGVEVFSVDYERVDRMGGKGNKWNVTEPSTGLRSRWDFENDLGWYKFHNMMDTLETIIIAEAIIVGGVVLLASGAGSALITLGGGAKMVSISIGISVLIYAITADNLTIEGFLKAALDGYLMAVGFKLFSPAGAGVARWIGTNTFKQKLIGLIGRGIVTGGASGAFTGAASMLIEDILRGELRSPGDYLKGAAWGAIMGAMFEVGGSLILAPLFRVTGRHVLEKIGNIQQFKDFLKKSGIVLKPGQWGPEVSKSFAGFTKWLKESVEDGLGNQLKKAVKNKSTALLDSFSAFAEGFELTVHRQALELIEVGMTKEAVEGLEKLISSSRTTLGKTAYRGTVDDVLNQLKANPSRSNPFFNLIKAADDQVMEGLLKGTNLKDLASSEGILKLATNRPALQVNNLMRFQFKGGVNDLESWAQRLLAQADDHQKKILGLLESRGGSVTPESLLRLAQSGAGFSDDVLNGLTRMVHKVRSSESLLRNFDEMLAQVSDDKMGDFLKTMGQMPEGSFDDMMKLVNDPAQAGRLLNYVDDTSQLLRMLQATGKKPADLDQLFQATKGKVNAPKEIESLLSRYGGNASKVQKLVKQIDGDATLLERSMAKMGKTDLEKILQKGQGHAVSKNDPASMRRLLQMAEDNAWVDGNKLKGFIHRLHRNQAQQYKHTFTEALDRLDDFVKYHSKSSAPPPVLSGHGPLNLASKDSFVELTLSSGTTVKPHANANNLQHYKEGHTFENFWFDPSKIDRSGVSTFWPPGTADDIILQDLKTVMKNPSLKTLADGGLSSGFGKSPPFIPSGSTKFQIGINTASKFEVEMFFPKTGTRAIPISKHILHAVKDLLGL